MKKKLENILLVDDDDDCNYFHKRLLNDMKCAENVEVTTDGQEALDYLTTKVGDGKYPQPQIIFLDINMPVMDGWEFMEEYHNLDTMQKGEIVLIMLTTSLNPDDKARASKFEEIKDFQNKLLTRKRMEEIFAEHFPEYI